MLFAVALAMLWAGAPIHGEQAPHRIYFLGNSHTSSNDVPGLVRSLLVSGGFKVETEMATGGHLDDIEKNTGVKERIERGKWTHVVLQGAMISSSHKYEYSQAGGIALAARVKKAGAKALLFAEWPRKGWDESDYIYKHYGMIQKEAGGEILPVCFAWDAALKAQPKLELWASDGNHSNLAGAYLAACTIAYWIAGPESNLKFVPTGVDEKLAGTLKQTARATVASRKRA